ncbi:DUF2158 domain-containing protein [Acinetobacter variabilis]|uniref:DUF2158 domain-containing protein n=1 Tax=Acinetobacter variabilis TaxID=70346 RepID=A0A7T7WL08_9GAMM|nr:DUF2158 domain-containing protein [Acinetobacter variabilis]QQN89415.1 DUF2158 domain-containing protein [Acinetobacter variabilis]
MSEERKPKYQIGDIVKLNAGGPDMTILKRIIRTPLSGSPYFSGLYQCQWFAGKKLDSGEFQEAGLILVKSQSETNET